MTAETDKSGLFAPKFDRQSFLETHGKTIYGDTPENDYVARYTMLHGILVDFCNKQGWSMRTPRAEEIRHLTDEHVYQLEEDYAKITAFTGKPITISQK